MPTIDDYGHLSFAFPEVHPAANVTLTLMRTFRIPDDGQAYPLPPGFEPFPLRRVEELPRVPAEWRATGGFIFPMYTSEALWISFSADWDSERQVEYPMAIQVAAGRRCALTGEPMSDGLRRPQNYVVAPRQPWLDGFCTEPGVIRQFVAMPLGEGFTAEEQLTGDAAHGGIQFSVRPMRRHSFEARFPVRPPESRSYAVLHEGAVVAGGASMGLAPGGRMAQQIYPDPYGLDEWADEEDSCHVQIANAVLWRALSGEQVPHPPWTAKDYEAQGMPWFDHYAESATISPGRSLRALKGVAGMLAARGEALADNESVIVPAVIDTTE